MEIQRDRLKSCGALAQEAAKTMVPDAQSLSSSSIRTPMR